MARLEVIEDLGGWSKWGEREDEPTRVKWGRSTLLYGVKRNLAVAEKGPAAPGPDNDPDGPGRSGGKSGPSRTRSGAVRAAAHMVVLTSQTTARGAGPDPAGPSPARSGVAGPVRTGRGLVRRGRPQDSEHSQGTV